MEKEQKDFDDAVLFLETTETERNKVLAGLGVGDGDAFSKKVDPIDCVPLREVIDTSEDVPF